MEKKLQRDEHNKMIAGVCAGLAEYLSIDITLVRAVFLITLIFHGAGLLPYIVLWIAMPKKLYSFNNNPFNNTGPVDYTVPPTTGPYDVPNQPGAPFVMPPKKASNASIIVGIALVAFGSFFLLDEFDFLPDWDFSRLWPIVFVVMGLVLIFSRKKQNPWDKENWHVTEQPDADIKEEPAKEEPTERTDKEDNTPTV